MIIKIINNVIYYTVTQEQLMRKGRLWFKFAVRSPHWKAIRDRSIPLGRKFIIKELPHPHCYQSGLHERKNT